MQLKALSIKDKKIFTQYLRLGHHELSTYAFPNIYLWRGIFDIRWALIEDNLCIFFKDKLGCFLYLPPLGKHLNPQAIAEAFRVMDSFNQNKKISRIENVEEKDLPVYRKLGYECKEKFADYLCKRLDLVNLRGNKFKHKRATVNYFTKHYKFQYLPFNLADKKVCLRLYHHWMKERKSQNQDPVYQGMLKDSRACLEILFGHYQNLDCVGRIVKINGRISAFTFGFKLNLKTFCILYEIADLSVKGLAQFIFREFCTELTEYKYINIMDDSGLENLKAVKLSYHPIRLIPNYIVQRNA